MTLAKAFLAIGIAILFAVFVGYGLFVIYEPPREYRSSGCYEKLNCDKMFQPCQPTNYSVELEPKMSDCWRNVSESQEYQDCQALMQDCEDQYRISSPAYYHSRNSFYVLIAIGIIAIIAGVFLNRFEGIGSGFIGGGVLVVLWSIIYTFEYWLTFSKYIKLFALGAALAVLIYFGYKKLDKPATKN